VALAALKQDLELGYDQLEERNPRKKRGSLIGIAQSAESSPIARALARPLLRLLDVI